MSLDIKRAFKLTVSSTLWFQKILIGSLVTLVGGFVARVPHVGGLLEMLVMSLVLGYTVLVMTRETRATAASLPLALPDWENWGELFKNGLLVTGLNLIYLVGFWFLAVASTLLLGGTGALATLGSGNPEIPAVVALLWLFLFGVALVLFGIFLPLMSAHFAHEGRFSAGFEVGTIFKKLFAHPGNVVITVFAVLGVLLVALIAGATIILAPFAVFTAQVIVANLWGQVYRCAGSDSTPAA